MNFPKTLKGKLQALSFLTTMGFSILILLVFISDTISTKHKEINQTLFELKSKIITFSTITLYDDNRILFDTHHKGITETFETLSLQIEQCHFSDNELGTLKDSLKKIESLYEMHQENDKEKLKKSFQATLQELETVNNAITDRIDTNASRFFYTVIGISFVILIIIFLITLQFAKNLHTNLQKILDFFNIKNDDRNIDDELIVDTDDEIGEIARQINTNVMQNIRLIHHNKEVLEEANDVLQKVTNGFYGYKIPHHNNVSSYVKELIINVNKMLDETKVKFDIINNALAEYGKYNFDFTISKKDNSGLYGDFGSLVASTKLIGNNVAEFLAMIVNTGEKLKLDTNTLSHSSLELSNASNSGAASLEETAAALEEITENIKGNRENVIAMSRYANELFESSNAGQKLAIQTAHSMDSINSQVIAINEAITIIDQIAFQTNILSLNAAVEAATAGEAGKGFAVVAGEVRNLATRSADAANEIKKLVQNATAKTTEGKNIASLMSKGYEALSLNIKDTIEVIERVSVASKEQQIGIEQINNAITTLDRNTQINAQNSQHIATLSSSIATLSNDLITIASNAKFNDKIKKQVCDVSLVYKTSQLKNDHVTFKTDNFQKLGTYGHWRVKQCNECEMGRWIQQCEMENLRFVHTKEWRELKEIHSNVHSGVQTYIDKNNQKVSNTELRTIAAQIERSTLALFDKFNDVKVINCELQ